MFPSSDSHTRPLMFSPAVSSPAISASPLSDILTACWASGHTHTQQLAGDADDLQYLLFLQNSNQRLTKYAKSNCTAIPTQFANRFKYMVPYTASYIELTFSSKRQ